MRGARRLDAIGINPGDVLSFSRDQQVTATVVSDTQVDLSGEPLALSPAAVKVLHSMGGKTKNANGWKYLHSSTDTRQRKRKRP